ncbi:MAG: 4Fe-4S ferredoxin [Thermoproteota archaeon]|nr:4Fe-4S ferredoxin [Thermoproteota archaeon]
MKHFKEESIDKLTISQILYTKQYGLTVDRNLCKGCVVCKLVCPREAITLVSIPKGSSDRIPPPSVDIDENKCDFHAICAVTCPFGAIQVTVNNEAKLPTVEKDAYPTLIRDIQIDSERCQPDCKICEDKCPLNAISIHFETLTNEEKVARKEKNLPATSKKTVIDVNKKICAACRLCEAFCPEKVIKVTKFFDGSIKINQKLCPQGCHNCIDVCPVDALYLDNNRVHVNDMFCIYCGACSNVCPKPQALELSRTSIRHTPIKSGTWNKTLEKLTSTSGLNKELGAKRVDKIKTLVKSLNLPR